MLRQTLTKLNKNVVPALRRRAYTSVSEQPNVSKAAHSLAEEALAQKTGGASTTKVGSKATLPKGDKKPTKAKGEKDNSYKEIALTAGVFTGLGLGGLLYYGRPFNDGREDKYVQDNTFAAAYKRCKDRFHEFQQRMNEPMWDKLLPEPLPEPYRRPYTLVINLDETLVYSTWDKEHGWRHAKRPGVDYFLAYLSQFYEIVIFTSQPSMNAQPLLDKLDPYQYAMYRLYREGTRFKDGKYIKDLSHLNRDLSKVIIMDSNPDAFSLQPENGIALKPWKGEAKDHGLLDYIPFLEAIALTSPDDIRPVLKSFEGKHIPIEWSKREEEIKKAHIKQWEEEQAQKKGSRNLGSLLTGGATKQTEGPPPHYLDQMRKQVREAFASEFEQQKKMQEEAMAQDMERQMQMMKDMKMSVWDLMTQAVSGQPLMPPPDQQQQQQPSDERQ